MDWWPLGAFFLLCVAYFAVGGVGGILGRVAQPARPPLPPGSQTAFAASVASGPRDGSGAGFSRAEALATIDAFYASDLNVVALRLDQLVPTVISADSLNRTGEAVGYRVRQPKRDPGVPDAVESELTAYVEQQAVNALKGAVLSRTLRDLTDGERATLRLADMLQVLGEIDGRDIPAIRLPIVWNEGRCLVQTVGGFERADRMTELRKAIGDLVTAHGGHATMATERVQAALRGTLQSPTVAAGDKSVLERYLFGGARWLTPADVPADLLPHGPDSPSMLYLGAFDGGADLRYDMPQSLITIASPGSGKSQAQVLRNLLRLRGGAMVLDIKGEMFDGSAGWRATLGPVARFAPGTAGSVHINPLDWVRKDAAFVWDDADRLASLLYVPPDTMKGDAYFESRSTSLIKVAVAYIAMFEEGAARTMYGVVSLLYSLADEKKRAAWHAFLEDDGSVPQLVMEAGVLIAMPDKQREGVLDGTRSMLGVWLSPEVSAVTADTGFDAVTLRQGGTLYLCVGDEDIERLASVVRTVTGIMMRSLMHGGADRTAPIVTFFLDELPRLKRMELVEKMLDLGRGYSIRMWLFAQNYGQLRERYPNADGILKNCAARCYMNLDPDDAMKISKLLGEREGLLDGRRKPLAEHWEIAGPEFEDKVLVFLRSGLPAKLTKVMAYKDPVCAARLERAVP